jgi:hypothetical protein
VAEKGEEEGQVVLVALAPWQINFSTVCKRKCIECEGSDKCTSLQGIFKDPCPPVQSARYVASGCWYITFESGDEAYTAFLWVFTTRSGWILGHCDERFSTINLSLIAFTCLYHVLNWQCFELKSQFLLDVLRFKCQDLVLVTANLASLRWC